MVKKEVNGTYTASFHYRDYLGNSKHKTKRGFKLARDAKEFEHDFLAKVAGDCNMLFKDLAEYYLEDCKARLRPTTMDNKYHIVRKIFIPVFGKMQVNAITAEVIRCWQIDFQNKAPYSETYKRNIINMLSEIFYFACTYYKLQENPVVKIKKMGKARNNHIDFWTVEEFNRFIIALNDKEANHKLQIKRKIDDYILTVAYKLFFYSGCRLGEVLALTKQDFDFTKGTVHINKTLSTANGKLTLIELPTTDKSNRIISLPSKILDLIKEYISKLDDDLQLNCRIFYMLNKSNLRRALISGARVAGLKQIRIHDLRHSHASLLINQGYNIRAVADRLGHENIQTTLNIYGHLYNDVDAKIANELDELIK